MKNIVILIILLLILFFVENYVNKCFEKLYKSVEICTLIYEQWIISQNNLQLYIITNDNIYLEKYKIAMNIINGKEDWESYEGQQVTNVRGKISLNSLIDTVELNKEEKDLYIKASVDTQQLLWYEIESINWTNGRYDKNDEEKKIFFSNLSNQNVIQFKQEGVVDRDRALKQLFNIDRIELSYNTLDDIKDLRELVSKRYYTIYENSKHILYIVLAMFQTQMFLLYKSNSTETNKEYPYYNIINSSSLVLSMLLSLSIINIQNKNYSKYNSLIVSNLFQNVVSLMTDDSRFYISTNEHKYMDEYLKMLDLRNPDGKTLWSSFSRTYGISYTESTSIPQIQIKSGFKEDELLLFQQAYEESNNLVWKQMESFNWKNGRWDKDNIGKAIFRDEINKTMITFTGVYDEEGKKDEIKSENKPIDPKQASIDNLYSNEYIQLSSRIKSFTRKAEKLIIQRVEKDVIVSRNIYFMIIAVFICMLLFTFYKT